ncbi:dirigent protein 9-like [Momordica charantia]|uniref:Dirigent protein n=1 Tax=Momordica charantia TaxID=3673 RepID=A0A6J1C5K0_MOMCH|nr:dirigent protein 9-like [Momordica charantia]
MANPTKIPLSIFLVVTALSSADSSRILLQVVPQPFDLVNPPAAVGPLLSPSPQHPLVMGLTTMISPDRPGPQPQVSVSPSSNPTLSFFMHDVLGGSHPSARVVTGITAESDTAAADLPFSKPNKNIFPLPGGVPLINNNKNYNSGKVLTAGQLTAMDDELTEGEELGSAVMGRAQGFYFVCSSDGSSHTIAFTVVLHQHNQDDGKDEDTISFFGVHRRVSPESPIAVVGGTGKYEKAGGFAVIENLRRRENQHMTDGEDMIVRFSVYLS